MYGKSRLLVTIFIILFFAGVSKADIGENSLRINLISRLTAQKNVELPMVYQDVPGKSREKRAKELIEMLGLGERARHKPAELSGGQRQRVAIARALANEPEIILADEPTGNLDSKTGQEIMQIFDKIHSEGRTILMVTHDRELADNCDRIIKLKDGKIETGV